MTRQNQAERREQAYRRNIRLATIAALVLISAAFLAVKLPEPSPYAPRREPEVVLIQPDGSVIYEPPKPPPVAMPKQLVADPLGKATGSSVGQHQWDPFVTRRELPGPEPLPYYKVEVKPEPIHIEIPEYPEACRAVGIEGRVAVRVLVDTIGGVSNVEIAGSSGNSLLDAAASEAAYKCRFRPGYQQGRPVPVWVAVPFWFRLN